MCPWCFIANGADGYDMDYTDSKSIRPRSQVCTRLGWNPFFMILSSRFKLLPTCKTTLKVMKAGSKVGFWFICIMAAVPMPCKY